MRRYFVLATLCAAIPAAADTLTLKSGRVIDGTYLGGTSRQVRMETGDKIETYDISDVASIKFGPGAPAPAPRAEPAATILRPDPAPAQAPAPRTTASSGRQIPAGTAIVIRMIDGVDSEVAQVGQTFQASLDEAVVVDGQTVAPRGADVVVKLVDDKQAGRLTGRTELTLDLVSMKIDGRDVDLATQAVTQASESRTRDTAVKSGGGAALGAIIGAIAGGGRGAAIGAVTGGVAGGAVQVLTKGPKVKIPSETRLTFTLDSAVRI
jgi:type V secretory pathway adhesin AidA